MRVSTVKVHVPPSVGVFEATPVEVLSFIPSGSFGGGNVRHKQRMSIFGESSKITLGFPIPPHS
jgi:hypothetical protein